MNGLWDEIRVALHAIWSRRWAALGIAWGLAMIGWLVIALIPNSYESRARILIDLEDVLADQIGITPADRQRQIEQVGETLASAVVLEKVVKGTALGDRLASPRELEGKIALLRENVTVVAEQDNLFEITATLSESGRSDAENAQLAQAVVQKMIDQFREEDLAGGAKGDMAETLRFLDRQLAERQRLLEAAEQARVEFETRNAGLMPGIGSASSQITAARSELGQVEAQLAAAQSALAAINGQLAGTPPMIATPGLAPAAGGGGARAALSAAQAELAQARARGWTDSHPDVIAIKSQIAALRGAAASEGPTGGGGTIRTPNPAYTSLQSIRAERQANVAALTARRATLAADIAALSGKLSQEPGVAAEAARITRDYEVLKAQYDKLLADREALRLRGEVEDKGGTVRFRVIDPPTAPRAPVAPNRPLLLTGVLLAAIAGGIGGAFALGQLKTTFPSARRLARASGMTVLGAISETLTAAQMQARRRANRMFAAGIAGLVGIFALLLTVEFVARGSVV